MIEDVPTLEAPLQAESASQLLHRYETFLSTTLDDHLARSSSSAAEAGALAHFQEVARRVPAYEQFLRQQGVSAAEITNIGSFRQLPLVTKENYMRRFPLPDRCWDGKLERCEMIAVSSGSTGSPTFWPRSLRHELEIAYRFEQIFRDSFRAQQRTTLAVVCFAMGSWVGGLFTANCCRLLAQKGYPLTLVPPGNHQEEILRCVTELGPLFEQVVLLGYPPFLKNVIDAGAARGVDWLPRRIKLVLAGEVFSEEWRSLVGQRAGFEEPIHDCASLYGTADAGVLAVETPLSILIRRFLSERPAAARALFGESRLPTLAQYDPCSRYFESIDGTLLFTGDGGVPLVRYHIADAGGMVSFNEMLEYLQGQGFEVPVGVVTRPLPFVYVFGRSDFTVSYFGANVFPENVVVALEQEPVSRWVSGKFVMEVVEDSERNARLSVTVELLPGVEEREGMSKSIARSIRDHLLRLNSEFAHYVPPERQEPDVSLRPAGDAEYFPPGVKHRYSRPTAGTSSRR